MSEMGYRTKTVTITATIGWDSDDFSRAAIFPPVERIKLYTTGGDGNLYEFELDEWTDEESE